MAESDEIVFYIDTMGHEIPEGALRAVREREKLTALTMAAANGVKRVREVEPPKPGESWAVPDQSPEDAGS